MAAKRLSMRRIEKPWGRHRLGAGFADVEAGTPPVGEIAFEDAGEGAGPLLVKYLFTNQKMSVQVHPDDRLARAQGLAEGKDEAWFVVAAEPHATIGIGLRDVMDKDAFAAAVRDGSIEDKLCWRAVKPGDVFYLPAGTVHAIGGGLILVEVQQNVDVTYRLYDYGRPRALHVEEGIAASSPVPYLASFVPQEIAPGRRVLASGPAFVLEQWCGGRTVQVDAGGQPLWIVPLHGSLLLDGNRVQPGEVWRVDGDVALDAGKGTDMLLAYPGGNILPLAAC